MEWLQACICEFEGESKGEGCESAGVVEHSPNVRVQKVGTNQKTRSCKCGRDMEWVQTCI